MPSTELLGTTSAHNGQNNPEAEPQPGVEHAVCELADYTTIQKMIYTKLRQLIDTVGPLYERMTELNSSVVKLRSLQRRHNVSFCGLIMKWKWDLYRISEKIVKMYDEMQSIMEPLEVIGRINVPKGTTTYDVELTKFIRNRNNKLFGQSMELYDKFLVLLKEMKMAFLATFDSN